MKYQISEDRKTLTIIVDDDERGQLGEMRNLQSDDTMNDFLEPLTCNSELEWIYPVNTGDLTDAPMLGICGPEQRDDRTQKGYSGPKIHSGPGMIQPILERWAFMDYQVRSVLEDLRDNGECIFAGGEL